MFGESLQNNPWAATGEQTVQKKLFQEENIEEKVESPNSGESNLRSEYYGTYAKVSDSNVN